MSHQEECSRCCSLPCIKHSVESILCEEDIYGLWVQYDWGEVCATAWEFACVVLFWCVPLCMSRILCVIKLLHLQGNPKLTFRTETFTSGFPSANHPLLNGALSSSVSTTAQGERGSERQTPNTTWPQQQYLLIYCPVLSLFCLFCAATSTKLYISMHTFIYIP